MHTLPPTRGVRSEKTAPAHRLISEKDIVALFKTIPSTTAIGIRDRTLFLCYLYLGRRNRELRLLWQDIEPYTFTNKDGDAYEGYRYRYQAKGKPGWQYAELMREVYGQIVWYLTATDRLDSIKPGDGIFVQHFMTPDGKLVGFAKEPLSSSSIRHILKKYARAASLETTRNLCRNGPQLNRDYAYLSSVAYHRKRSWCTAPGCQTRGIVGYRVTKNAR